MCDGIPALHCQIHTPPPRALPCGIERKNFSRGWEGFYGFRKPSARMSWQQTYTPDKLKYVEIRPRLREDVEERRPSNGEPMSTSSRIHHVISRRRVKRTFPGGRRSRVNPRAPGQILSGLSNPNGSVSEPG